MNAVPQTHTPVDTRAACDAIWRAHVDVVGGLCPVSRLKHTVAQWHLETDGGRAMYNNNFGNIRGAGPEGDTMSIRGATEVDATGEHVVAEGFASYRTVADGARAFVSLLARRYPEAFAATDVTTYAAGLKAHGYFTADLTRYAAGLCARLAIISPIVDAWVEALAPKDTP